ncbi:MAG: cupin domain-containing protein [Rhodospirillaceae bacterium]
MTSARTPNAKNHESLADMASRFVSVADLPWEETRFKGVTGKTLLVDKETGLVTVLLKMEPGSGLPDHEHVLIEQTYVLEGHLVCAEGECGPGDFVWRPSGSRHTAWSPNGGLMLAMFQVPNKFFDKDGETDMLNQDWAAAWGKTATVQALRG